MSIRDNNDWQTLEIKARLAEAGQIHCEKVPEWTPQQINALIECFDTLKRIIPEISPEKLLNILVRFH